MDPKLPFRVTSTAGDLTVTTVDVENAGLAFEEVDDLLSRDGALWAEIHDRRNGSLWFAGFHVDINFADLTP